MESIVRLVTMTFDPDKIDTFQKIFDEVAPRIRATDGCTRLLLLQDSDDDAVFTTYSVWDSPAHLDRYRSSELFVRTWEATRSLFNGRPYARSLRVVRSVPGTVQDEGDL